MINLDKRLLSNYFKNNGYFKVKIENSFVEFDKNSNFNLIFNITPGKKYFFNDFSLNLPSNYDSMISKLIVVARTRDEAILKMKRALGEYIIEGVKTTIPFHQKLMEDPDFVKGNFTTKFMEIFEY